MIPSCSGPVLCPAWQRPKSQKEKKWILMWAVQTRAKCLVWAGYWFMILIVFHLSGHPSKAHGKGPDGAADSHRGSFREAKEGGRGASQPHRPDCMITLLLPAKTSPLSIYSVHQMLCFCVSLPLITPPPNPPGKTQVRESRADEDQGWEGERTPENSGGTSTRNEFHTLWRLSSLSIKQTGTSDTIH